jgi:hypothetical protein
MAQTGRADREAGMAEYFGVTPGGPTGAAQQLNQQAQVANLQAQQQTAAQQQQVNQKNSQLKAASLSLKSQLADQTEDLLQKFEQQNDLLDLDRYKSDLNQIEFNMRLSNNQYIDKLKLEGQRARFDDANQFAEALAAATFEDELSLLKNDLEFKELLFGKELTAKGLLAADSREFQQQVAKMDINEALRIAASDRDSRAEAMKYQAISGIIQAGAQAYNAYSNYKANDTKTNIQPGSTKALQTDTGDTIYESTLLE